MKSEHYIGIISYLDNYAGTTKVVDMVQLRPTDRFMYRMAAQSIIQSSNYFGPF